MFFNQFYLESLGHASYLLGDEATGQALVFDPRRDVEIYFDVARSKGLRIAYAIDSHAHNDYITGLKELAQRQDVEVLGFAGAGLGFDHRPVKDGEIIEMGDVGIEIIHTPGHTPEHLSLLVHDRSVADEPALLLSGGALLVGDVARPDLLGGREQAEAAARELCRTIREKILALPDHVEVFPTHVSGSLCASRIGSRLSTTIGYERRTNDILSKASSDEAFLGECIRLDDLPAPPPYWRRIRPENLSGPKLLGVLREPPALKPKEFRKRRDAGALVLDTRSPEAYGSGHIPGALNAGVGPMFGTWAGTVLPEVSEVLFVLDRSEDLWEATWQLLRIGYDPPIGWLAGGMRSWRTSGQELDQLPQISVHELKERLERDELNVLDVRQPGEWEAGHIDTATFVTGAELLERLDEVPEGKPLAVICGSGYRSSVSASLLKHHGRDSVMNVLGGMTGWKKAGYPTDSGGKPHGNP
jgi:hydroxyacylglutathione hydrolase